MSKQGLTRPHDLFNSGPVPGPFLLECDGLFLITSRLPSPFNLSDDSILDLIFNLRLLLSWTLAKQPKFLLVYGYLVSEDRYLLRLSFFI